MINGRETTASISSACGHWRCRLSPSFLPILAGVPLVLLLLMGFQMFPLARATPEGEALLEAKDAWHPQSNLSSWITGTDPCATPNWERVKCNDAGRVVYLNLSVTGIAGPIPPQLGSLEHLTVLDLSNPRNNNGYSNAISSDVSAIGGLTNLQALNLTFNPLNSEFPKAVLSLTNLIELRLDNCNLSGSIPKELSKLSKLEILYIGNNTFAGPFPQEFTSLVNLRTLSAWGIPYFSEILLELEKLANLTYLNLNDCQLSGGLPPEFQNLKSIQKLHLYRNQFSGIIPSEWSNLKTLNELRLEHNYLSKGFPSWTQNLPNLARLDLSNNFFYGEIPSLMNYSATKLDISCNYFSGAQPLQPYTMKSFNATGDCFKGVDPNDKRLCSQIFTDCQQFDEALANGCPPCPVMGVTGWTDLDPTTCVCRRETTETRRPIGIIVGCIIGVTLFLLFVLFGSLLYRKRSKAREDLGPLWEKRASITELSDALWEAPPGVQRFTLRDLARATSNFRQDHAIGRGGFSQVFRGTLDNGKNVAIKRASESSMQSSLAFRNEVLLLSRLHHRNLVHLEGFCEEAGVQILVYEYVPNGNLHTQLFNNDAGKVLDWFSRLDIAAGVAQGLEYLHSFAHPPVIHRDVKPNNILLDDNMVAKVADFGISKSLPEFDTHFSTRPAGTAGFIDPQYFLREQLTPASDVYGFGVVLMELITGQKAIDRARSFDTNLVQWVKWKLKNDGLRSIVDPRIGVTYPEEVYKDVIRLAVDCASFETEDRPSMKAVVSILDACLGIGYQYPRQEILLPQDELNEIELSLSTTASESTTIAPLTHSYVLPR